MGDNHYAEEDSEDNLGSQDSLQPIRAKTCYFYREQDYRFAGYKLAVNPKNYRRFDVLLAELTRKVPYLPYGVRSVHTPRGRHILSSIADLRDGGQYVCSSHKHRAHALEVERVRPPELWRVSKPKSGVREYNNLLAEDDVEELPTIRKVRPRLDRPSRATKKVTFLKNGEPQIRHVMLFARNKEKDWRVILDELSHMFKSAIFKIYTIEGKKVLGWSQLIAGPEALVAGGKENFRSMIRQMNNMPHPPIKGLRAIKQGRGRNPSNDSFHQGRGRNRNKPGQSRGNWKVTVTTNELSSAGTDAQVTLTVYGYKSDSGPIPLGSPDNGNFRNGQIDEFDINTRNVGEVYKIRIAQDNTGDYPSWMCDEVRMKDYDTGEELVFPCKRWLARDEDDHETCREISVRRRGEPVHPLVRYEVTVVTGNLWNAGTDANVYLTIYGDRGDTGVRQLYTESKQRTFKQGMTDTFEVEAVSLGRLKRIIVGHDSTGAGSGWFLERIVIKDPSTRHGDRYNFYCNKWLDEGEDDGKIVRELRVKEEYMDDIFEKSNWEIEKWKFESRNQVMLLSHATGKALRIKPDGSVDGLGEVKDTSSIFSVHRKKNTVHVFSSQLNPSFHLAIEHGKLLGHGRGGALCEFKVRTQSDMSVILESLKNPLQFVTIQESGRVGEVRGILDQDPTHKFSVYCKGMFRHRGIIMFRTSATQAISVDHDQSVYGTGRCNRAAHFRIHKVDEGGVRMFESMINPGNFLRLKDGKFDCNGDKGKASHFLVAKHREKGYVVLQSAISRGLYVGLTPQGKVHPTVDTGVKNVWLYPEVIEFGVPKQRDAKKLSSVREVRETPREPRNRSPPPLAKSITPTPRKSSIQDGDWKVNVSTSESLEDGEVIMVAYGDKGNSGAIMLAAPDSTNGPLFRTGNDDEFKVNLKKCGNLYKIRLELKPLSATKLPSWKVREVKMMDLKSKDQLKFHFNRWLSRKKDDGDIMRELPVSRRGKEREALPVMTYVVEVTTGKERDADTDADVSLTIFGERGDTGRRLLYNSNNRNPFRSGQVDQFELEAVHLGKLMNIQIGHNATRAGDGWYCEEVKIKEKKDAREEYVFPCNRWFDSSMEDRRIERTLHVKEPAPTKIYAAMRRESSEYASLVVSQAIEAATRNLQMTKTGRDSSQSNKTNASDLNDDGEIQLEKKEDVLDEDTDNSHVSDNDEVDLVPIEPDHDSTNTIGSEIENLDNNQENTKHTQGDSDNEDGSTDATSTRETVVDSRRDDKYRSGDWKVWTTTGQRGGMSVEDEVELFIYGSSGHVGPLTLGDRKNNFKPGKTDEFDVHFHRNLGDLYKLRVGLCETVPDGSWFLEKIALRDMTSKEEFNLKVNRWMSRSEDDHDVCREVPIASRHERPLPVNVYQVEVFTGGMNDADTSSNVSITIYGERGDTGKRKLYMSKSNKRAFQQGKIDVFDLEAVSLGDLERVYIGHDGVRAGKGWYLEKVVIKESTDVKAKQFYFPCEQWLDSGKGDKKIERELLPAEPPTVSQGDYKLWVKTATDSKPPYGGKVFIALYGTTGKSDDIELYAPSSKAKLFEPGSLDEFEVAVGDIGELQKIRMSREDQEGWKGWHLQEVTLQDKHTRDELVFKFDRWLGRGMDDSDLAREAAVTERGKPIQPVIHYELIVYTGDHWAGETDAEIYVNLYGSQGDTGHRVLYSSPSEEPKFRKGRSDKFVLEAVNLGELESLTIGHSSRGHGAGWFLDKVVVKETDSRSSVQYVFPCGQWLDDGEGDWAIERTLRVVDTIDTRKRSPKKKGGKDNGSYEVVVKTSDDPEAGTDSKVSITLCGKHGDSKPQPLSDSRNDQLQPGKLAMFQVTVGNIGEVSKIRLELEDARDPPAWRCDYVKLTNTATGEELTFYVDSWLAEKKDDGQMIREVAANERTDTRPGLQYVVMIQTGRGRGAGAPDGQVSINLYGTHGNTGLRPLTKSLSDSPRNMWRDGNLDVFVVPAISVGKLQQVQLKFVGNRNDREWNVERVTVLEGLYAMSETVFHCNYTMRDDREGCLHSFPVSETQISEGAPDNVIYRVRDRREPNSRGSWTVHVYTGGQSDAGTRDPVMMVVYGTKGHTVPKHVNKDAALMSGSTLSFNMNTGAIGRIMKVRLLFQSRNNKAAWFLQKIKMKDSDTGEEFNMEHNDWVKVTQDNPDGVVELPAIRPDIPPLQDTTYRVTVTTGDYPVADTDAEVFCTLIGQWGDTGERVLGNNQRSKPFRQGQKDVFEIQTLDLGMISKLMIGHKESGRGCGWHCESVSVVPVKPKQTAVDTVFMCNRWLDTGCDDRKLVRELTPLAHLEPGPEISPSQRSKSRGIWTCYVTMATEERLERVRGDVDKARVLDLEVYGSRNKEGPLELTDGRKTPLRLGQTEKFTDIKLKDVGEIEKIRLTLGDEQDDRHVWTVQKMVLEDPSTGEKLKFNFDPWVGEVNSDISKEVPVLSAGKPFPPMVDYEVSVYTGNTKNAATQSDVFICIYGKTQDSGRRFLRSNSKNSKKFQQGQVDLFTVSAVHLGELERISVTKGRGDPWFLDKISVKAGTFGNTEWIFEADRWIGDERNKSSEVDESLKLTRTEPSSVAIPAKSARDIPSSRGRWKVETQTGRGGTRGDVSDLVMVLCGERAASSPLPLDPRDRNPFRPNEADTCQVKLTEDVGELLKVRLGFKNNRSEKAWNLDKIRFEDEDTKDCFSYDFDSWVAVDNNQDGWREFPVIWPAVRTLPVLMYQVSITVGDVSRSSSDLDMFIEIVGDMGTTGQRQLKRSLNNSRKFQRDQTDEFQFEAVSVLAIQQVHIGHDSGRKGDGVYLKKVVIKEEARAENEYVFLCNRWLDKGEDDHAIERTLKIHSGPIRDVTPPNRQTSPRTRTTSPKSPPRKQSPTGDPWTVWTTTSNEPDCGTKHAVTMVIYGNKGRSESLLIGDDDRFSFKEGKKDKFEIKVREDPGEVFKVRLSFEGMREDMQSWYSDFSSTPSWKPEQLVLRNMKTKKEYEFRTRNWVRLTDYADFPLEIPVQKKYDRDMTPVYKYHVEVFTGDIRYAGTDANVYIQLFGDTGDSGVRHLHGSYTNKNKFEGGQCDLFEVEAVDLGKLKSVKVSHDGAGAGSGWYLDKVVIEVPQRSNDKYVFKCGRWLDEGQDDKAIERELSLSEIITADKPKVGDWQVMVTTGTQDDSGTDSKVYLTVYGEKGKSDEKKIDGHFESGRTDHIDIWLDPAKIGKIRKIRLSHDESGRASDWRVKQVVMINRESKDRLEFPINRWLSFSEEYGDIAVEAPAIWPNQATESVYKYIVQTTTASDWGAGTDANVHINIFGKNGDTGARYLRNSVEDKNKFETGNVDTFYVEAVDLGKLESVVIGHDGTGAGSGWKLENITVKVSDREVFVFNYGKWIDEDKDDKLTEVRIPLSTVKKGK